MKTAALVLVAAGLGAVAWADEAEIGQKPVTPLVSEALKSERYGFCHDPHFPLTSSELAWCAQVADDDKVCPAFKKACARGAQADEQGWRRTPHLDLPKIPAIGRGLLVTLLVVLGALLIAFLIRQFLDHRGAPSGRERPRDPGHRGADPEGATALALETDVNRLLDRARAAAAAGDYRQAMIESYAALLRKLEGSGLTRVEPHRTNGDYLGDLRAHRPELRPAVAAVVTELERVEFGGDPPGESRFRWVHDRVVGLCAERLGPLVLLLLLLGGGCQPERAAWEDSPSGHSALIAVLQKNGFQARERLTPLKRIGTETDTLVLLPGAPVDDDDWAALARWVGDDGGTLIIAGNDRTLPAWINASYVSAPGGPASLLLAKSAAERWGRLHVVVPPGEVAIESKSGQRLLSRQKSRYAVELEVGEGRVSLFVDDRLFCNAALLMGDDARFVTRLLADAGARVQFAGELMSVVARSPIAAVTRGRLAPALLQLALLALLFFLGKGAYFGRPHDPETLGRRVFADHARALGLNYARAGAGRLSLELYATWALERLRERLRLGNARTLSALAEGVAARTGRSTGEVMKLLLEAREPASADTTPPKRARRAADAEALSTQRRLARLLDEVGGAGSNARPDAPKPSR